MTNLTRLEQEKNALKTTLESQIEMQASEIARLEKELKEKKKELDEALSPEVMGLSARKTKDRLEDLTGIECSTENNLTEIEAKLGGSKLSDLPGTLTDYIRERQVLDKKLRETENERDSRVEITPSNLTTLRAELEEKIKNLDSKVNNYDNLINKNKELEKKLVLAETKFNNSQTNASQLSEKLAKKTEELKEVQKQNNLLNNQLAAVKSQLVKVQTENKENY